MEKELIKLTDIVKSVLEENPESRNSDIELYYYVCKFINPHSLTAKFGTVLRSRKEYGLPTPESVGRVRRKIVETHPDLKGTDEVEGGRWSYEQTFREYAKVKV